MEAEMERDKDSATEAASLAKGYGEEILLVEDDPNVLGIYRRILERLNYKVTTASDGREAVNLYRARRSVISLLVVDFMLPKLGGREVVQEIRAMNPEVKVIYITGHHGYYDQNSPEDEAGSPREMVLLKPFSIAELSRAIRDVLAG